LEKREADAKKVRVDSKVDLKGHKRYNGYHFALLSWESNVSLPSLVSIPSSSSAFDIQASIQDRSILVTLKRINRFIVFLKQNPVCSLEL